MGHQTVLSCTADMSQLAAAQKAIIAVFHWMTYPHLVYIITGCYRASIASISLQAPDCVTPRKSSPGVLWQQCSNSNGDCASRVVSIFSIMPMFCYRLIEVLPVRRSCRRVSCQPVVQVEHCDHTHQSITHWLPLFTTW